MTRHRNGLDKDTDVKVATGETDPTAHTFSRGRWRNTKCVWDGGGQVPS